MKKAIIFIVLLTILSGCQTQIRSKGGISKITRIESIMDSIGFISLPYIANFDTTINNTYRLNASNDLDIVLLNDFKRFGDVYLVGFLPDTSNFYGILFMGVAAVASPGLILFDKKGTKISSEFITEENCLIYVGDVLYCREYTQINSDMTLNYVYKSIVIQERTDMTLDTICTHIIRNGKVRNDGFLELGENDTLVCDLD